MIGGFFSIFVTVALVIYFIIHVDKLVNYRDDKIVEKTESINLVEADEIKYEESNYFVAFFLLDSTYTSPREYDDTAKRHMTIEF